MIGILLSVLLGYYADDILDAIGAAWDVSSDCQDKVNAEEKLSHLGGDLEWEKN